MRIIYLLLNFSLFLVQHNNYIKVILTALNDSEKPECYNYLLNLVQNYNCYNHINHSKLEAYPTLGIFGYPIVYDPKDQEALNQSYID